MTKLEEIKETIKRRWIPSEMWIFLVNNAAGFGGGKTFDKMTYEEGTG